MSTLRTELITDFDCFANCQVRWNQLVDDRLFHSWEWMFSWWETWQNAGQLAIVVVKDQNDMWVGVAPWFKTVSASRGRVIRSLGSGVACSDYVSLAIRPGYEDVVTREIIEMTIGDDAHELFRDVDLFEIEGHLSSDPAMSSFVSQLDDGTALVACEEIAATWRVALPDSWEEFEQGLAKSFRRKTKKANKRLDSDEFTPSVIWAPEEIEDQWNVFVDLHQRRRISLGQPGCFSDERFSKFLKTATLRLALRARAQINLVCHQGVPLTTNLEFIGEDSIYMYQTGMDPDRLKLEPGHLTFSWAIRESINRQFPWFDFLRGDEPYKARWNAERVPIYRTRIIPNRLKSKVRHSLLMAGRQFRDWSKAVLRKQEI